MSTPCSEEGCDNEVVGQGLCRKHYMRVWRNGTTKTKRQVRAEQTCSEEGCDAVVDSRGLCTRHYRRVIKRERVLRGREGRQCEWCSKPIPIERTGHAIYCSSDCKTSAQNFKRSAATKEEYEEALRQQGGRCAICGATEGSSTGRLAVDHCHVGDSFRGLLCYSCNTGLGHFGDDVIVMDAAVRYLKAGTAGWGPVPLVKLKFSAPVYEYLFAERGSVCAICGSVTSRWAHARFILDHCHQTGLCRGFLCQPCNSAIGLFDDDPDRILSAIAHLTQR